MTAFQHFRGNHLNDKKELKLILVAARNQLSSNDIKSLIAYLESDDCEFEISLQISEPTEPVSYTHLTLPTNPEV